MASASAITVPDLVVQNLSRDMVMGIEDGLLVGARKAYDASIGMNDGHLPSVLGQLRHFNMNEGFFNALAAAKNNPTPLRGNNVVAGRAGIFVIGRFNVSAGVWNNSRRSRTRREMAFVNRAIESLVQPGLFDEQQPITEAAAFFVACFSGSVKIQPEAPVSIHLAVPDKTLTRWLFREPIEALLARYDVAPAQSDLAIPTLKKSAAKRKRIGDE